LYLLLEKQIQKAADNMLAAKWGWRAIAALTIGETIINLRSNHCHAAQLLSCAIAVGRTSGVTSTSSVSQQHQPWLPPHCRLRKAARLGIFIHGCIDGGSNYVVYMTVALNKSAAALLHGFERAVADFGYPLRLRADMALEAQGIGQRMLDVRGAGAYLTGPSTANQVDLLCTTAGLLAMMRCLQSHQNASVFVKPLADLCALSAAH
jgi:hypothetical protein